MRVLLRAILFTAGLFAIVVGLIFHQGRQNEAEAYWEIGSTYYGPNEEIYRVIVADSTPEYTTDAFGYTTLVQGPQLRMTNNPDVDTLPAWSPDGQWIVYVTRLGNRYYLYRMAAGGADRKNLGEIRNPYAGRSWSLDSEWVVVGNSGSFNGEQFAVHLASGRRIALNTTTAQVWTPDSQWIIYTNMQDPYRGIWRVNTRTGEREQLTDGLADFATLSPDGQFVVYTSGVGVGNFKQIHRMLPDGTAKTALTDGKYPCYDPHISPDSQWILFLCDRDGYTELYKMRADGSGRIQLTENTLDEQNLAWAPDGTKIYFWGMSPVNQIIRPYELNPDGTAMRGLESTPNFSRGDFRSPVVNLDWQLWLPFAAAAVLWGALILEIRHYRRQPRPEFPTL